MTSCQIGGKPHTAADGLLVCPPHLQQLATWLRDVEDEAEHLDPVPSMAIRMDSGGGGLASQGSPVNLDVVVATDRRRGDVRRSPWSAADEWSYDDTLSVFEVLHRWAQLVRDERQLKPRQEVRVGLVPGGRHAGPICAHPCMHGSCQSTGWWWLYAPAAPTIATERELLSRHLEHAAAQPWISRMHADLRRLRSQVKAANGTSDPRPIGRCPLPTDDAAACGGPLRYETTLVHTAGGDTPVETGAIRCGSCGRRWEAGREIALLAIQLDQHRKAST